VCHKDNMMWNKLQIYKIYEIYCIKII